MPDTPTKLLGKGKWGNPNANDARVLTTNSVTTNSRVKLHVDKNTDGPSLIIEVGMFTGGELWVTEPEYEARMFKRA